MQRLGCFDIMQKACDKNILPTGLGLEVRPSESCKEGHAPRIRAIPLSGYEEQG